MLRGGRGGEASANQDDSRVPRTCTACATPLEELEDDIDGNGPGQGAPRGLLSQQVHYGDSKSEPNSSPEDSVQEKLFQAPATAPFSSSHS